VALKSSPIVTKHSPADLTAQYLKIYTSVPTIQP